MYLAFQLPWLEGQRVQWSQPGYREVLRSEHCPPASSRCVDHLTSRRFGAASCRVWEKLPCVRKWRRTWVAGETEGIPGIKTEKKSVD